jgi:uncharacterized protein
MLSIEDVRALYPEVDPVHGFDHVLRVLNLAEWLGEQLGADTRILRAAAFLHDAEDAHPGEQSHRGEHEHASATLARELLLGRDWSEEDIAAVEHCILSHRYRGQAAPQSLEAKILFDADKLDVVGAFGVARTIGYALQAGQPIYSVPSRRFIETGEKEPDEPHSAYHEYLFKLRKVKDRLFTEPAKMMAEDRHKLLCAYFDQMAREAQGYE